MVQFLCFVKLICILSFTLSVSFDCSLSCTVGGKVAVMFNFDATIHRDRQCVSSLLLECHGSDMNRERNTSSVKLIEQFHFKLWTLIPSRHEAESCLNK